MHNSLSAALLLLLASLRRCDPLSSAGVLLDTDFLASATAAAEEASLSAAWGEAWVLNKCFQYFVEWTHSSTGTPWWDNMSPL